MAFRPIPQPRILDIEPYVPGESKSSATRVIRLAANENPFGTSAKVQAAFVGLAQGLHRYPDGGSQSLRRALANFHGIDADRIVCGTGSDEIITILCKAFAGQKDEVLYSEFGFLMYPLAALSAGATPVKAPESNRATDLDALLDAVTEKTKIVFLANPNNPTGCLISRAEISSFREKLRENIILVIDSAYAEYVTDGFYTDGKDLVSCFDNIIMLRTFSKAYGLSGLRVGWSYSSAYIADILNRVRGVFNLSVPAQVCAELALSDQDFISMSVDSNTAQRDLISAELAAMGTKVYPSGGNFVLFSLGSTERADDCLTFLKERGILLRGMKAYNLPDCIRMTIGRPEDMKTVAQELKHFLL